MVKGQFIATLLSDWAWLDVTFDELQGPMTPQLGPVCLLRPLQDLWPPATRLPGSKGETNSSTTIRWSLWRDWPNLKHKLQCHNIRGDGLKVKSKIKVKTPEQTPKSFLLNEWGYCLTRHLPTKLILRWKSSDLGGVPQLSLTSMIAVISKRLSSPMCSISKRRK